MTHRALLLTLLFGGFFAVVPAATNEVSVNKETPRTREKDLAAQREALEQDIAAQGGFAAWEKRLEPFRAALAAVRAVSKEREDDIFPGVNGHLFSRGRCAYLLDRDLLHVRSGAPNAPIDALSYKTIVDLNRQLAGRGVDLIVVPVPPGMEVFPDRLGLNVEDPFPVAPQRTAFLLALANASVEVVDLLPILRAAKDTPEAPVIMPDDPHWGPVGIEAAATAVAERLARYDFVRSTQAESGNWKVVPARVKSPGALIKEMPESKRGSLTAATIDCGRVQMPDGTPYTDAEKAPIIVAGDSYLSQFAEAQAGFSAHLARNLGQQITPISVVGGGPAVPRELARKGPGYLEGRRVVVWLFVARYLALMRNKNWIQTDLP